MLQLVNVGTDGAFENFGTTVTYIVTIFAIVNLEQELTLSPRLKCFLTGKRGVTRENSGVPSLGR